MRVGSSPFRRTRSEQAIRRLLRFFCSDCNVLRPLRLHGKWLRPENQFGIMLAAADGSALLVLLDKRGGF